MNTRNPRDRVRASTAALSGVALLTLGLGPVHAQTSPAAVKDGEKGLDLEQVVVTGVFQGVKKEDATVAISTVNSRELEKLVPQSAADLLTNVPGVFVDSSHGEIRNVIYSRGVSANSLDGASGYFYVAMEEDGLPVTNVTWSNFGPDYFLRADATIDRFEAVRGGAAAVTGPNAPGGIFNYISKRGTDEATGQVTLRSGLEGDGQNPYYRGDLWLGGPLGKGWNYSVGGFYRRSDGPQYPRFPMNEGGQVKLNLSRQLEHGYIQFYGKYLDDTNGFSNFIAAQNFSDPRPAPGWNNASNPTPPRTAFDYQVGPNDFVHFDSSRQQKNTSKVIGMRFETSLGADASWKLRNDAKYSDSKVVWNTWIGILPQSMTDFFTPVFYGAFGQLGTFTYRDGSGRAAHIAQSDFLTASVIDSNLPGNNLMPGSGMAQIALDFEPGLKEFMDQASVTKEFEHMAFTLGAFYSASDARVLTRTPGFGMTTLEPDSQALDVSAVTTGGQTLQVTNPAGIGPVIGNSNQSASWDQISVFFGHRWDFAPKWSFDWGARAESIDVSVTNPTLTGNPVVASATGGLDGNPNTLYDNVYAPAPTSFFTFGKKIHNHSYTGALFRKLGERQSIYVRYSDGAKAPDLAIFFAQNDPTTTQFANTSSQKIKQVEVGYKFAGTNTSLVVTPYYSLLSNVQTTQLFVNTTDATFYPRISANSLESYGVELESDWNIGAGFSLRSALTWQRTTATKRFNWIQGATPDQDVLEDLSGGRADNNPNAMATVTPSYARGRFFAQAQWRYMGKRPANAANAFSLPGFDTMNLMASWLVTPAITLSATINNAFNSGGVMGFSVPATNLVAALNRQSLTKEQIQAAPNALFTILPIQARAYFLEAAYKF